LFAENALLIATLASMLVIAVSSASFALVLVSSAKDLFTVRPYSYEQLITISELVALLF